MNDLYLSVLCYTEGYIHHPIFVTLDTCTNKDDCVNNAKYTEISMEGKNQITPCKLDTKLLAVFHYSKNLIYGIYTLLLFKTVASLQQLSNFLFTTTLWVLPVA